MKGVITKKHFFEIWRAFGMKKALLILFSINKTKPALTILMA
jgi:hypothetical protein